MKKKQHKNYQDEDKKKINFQIKKPHLKMIPIKDNCKLCFSKHLNSIYGLLNFCKVSCDSLILHDITTLRRSTLEGAVFTDKPMNRRGKEIQTKRKIERERERERLRERERERERKFA